MSREIILSSGEMVLVDDEDYDWLSQWKWKTVKATVHRYAARNSRNPNDPRRYTSILMHRLIMDAPKGKQVDHINGDPLDNRRSNLRLCNQGQNNAAGRPNRNKMHSKYKGVFLRTDRKHPTWRVRLKRDGKQRSGGHFKDEKEAARAYDKLARESWGDFAYQNFPGVAVQTSAAGGPSEPPVAFTVLDGRPRRLYRKGLGEGVTA